MAIVRKLEPVKLERDSKHSEVNCTYSIVIDDRGANASKLTPMVRQQDKIRGKKNQSIRFSLDAIEQLRSILKTEF